MKTAEEIKTIVYEAVSKMMKQERDSYIGKVELRACDKDGWYIDASNEWIGPFKKIPPLSEIEKAQAKVQERDDVGVMFLCVYVRQIGTLISEIEVNVTTGELEYW